MVRPVNASRHGLPQGRGPNWKIYKACGGSGVNWGQNDLILWLTHRRRKFHGPATLAAAWVRLLRSSLQSPCQLFGCKPENRHPMVCSPVTRARTAQKWLFVASGNAATVSEIKAIGILSLRSLLSAEIKGTISRKVAFCEAVAGARGTQGLLRAYLMNAGGMSRFISWSSVVWTVSFPTCNTQWQTISLLIPSRSNLVAAERWQIESVQELLIAWKVNGRASISTDNVSSVWAGCILQAAWEKSLEGELVRTDVV